MKTDLHPTWYESANVVCACGNTWITGATVPEIRTDICSACHPFYTGEQRIVDTEGRVDKFMKRLQARDQIVADAQAREENKTPPNLLLSELDLSARFTNILEEHGITTVSDFFAKLEAGGDEAILEIPGIGRKVLSDIKKNLKTIGYELPAGE